MEAHVIYTKTAPDWLDSGLIPGVTDPTVDLVQSRDMAPPKEPTTGVNGFAARLDFGWMAPRASRMAPGAA